ncbi:MAG: molecular chaperone TorD family protein [Rhodobiaceae bacterium]|nr:molecular chaperone TorD family protein [Rhodobiaceae bacterium]MCC0049678.1 molecular chaperone TorD family protein [Rhodobiaceae bacterium]
MHAQQSAVQTPEGIVALSDEEAGRGHLYRLIGRLLARAPSTKELANTAMLSGDDSEIGQAISALAAIASKVDAATVEREYHDLFIGLGRGELVPYGSYYLTGFLHEKPLAKLRGDLSRLGVERAENVKEPEDHMGAMCEVMGGLILGSFGQPASLETQKAFFEAHLAPWAGHFFRDLEKAKSSVFYAPVGRLGRAMAEVEEAAFSMV